ncbi:MAG TPA: hypothetical protein PKB14_04220 [Rubrivivax sp.]|nr:hypothetical protein [Rubrivivax sp.]
MTEATRLLSTPGAAAGPRGAAPRRVKARCRRAVAVTAITAVLLGAASGASAQTDSGWRDKPAFARLGYETIELPGGEKMGLAGLSYLVQPTEGLCLGPAVYGAASGQRGGFFTIGGEGALCTRVYGPLNVVAGLYVGGGGGAAAPQGGGLMLRPHVDLLWDFGPLRAGVSWSKVYFPNGDIDSDQVGLILDVPMSFGYLPAGQSGLASWSGQRGGIGFDRVLAVAGVYAPRGHSLGRSGAPLPSHIGYVGARAETQLRPSLYIGLEANGAASGGTDGYAEILGTLGSDFALGDSGMRIGGRVALGMGGGGDMPTGGGLLAKAALDFSVPLSRDFSLGLEAGWAAAPQGDFGAPFGSLALRWALDPLPGVAPVPVRQEWSAGAEMFFDAARKDGSERDLQSLSFKYSRFVGQHLYLSGQVQSAYQGGAGGFTVGLFGIGGLWRSGQGLLAGAEFLAGAAGGGGVDTGSGAVLKPMAYVGWELTPAASLRLGGGWIKAPNGELSSPVLDLSVVFAFDVPGRP